MLIILYGILISLMALVGDLIESMMKRDANINKKTRTKVTRGKKVKVRGFKKAIITLKKGQNIDLTTGI